MNKKLIKKRTLLPMIVCLLPILVGLVLYNKLPEQLPIHWNAAGKIDNYGNKAVVLFGFPLFFTIMEIIMIFITETDPKKQNYSDKIKTLIYWFMPATLLVVYALIISAAMDYNVNIVKILGIFMGVLFTAIGNYLPKCKQNYTIGYKLPWALEDEENWNKTHRLAGYLMTISGLALIVVTLLTGNSQVFMATVLTIIVISFIPMIYSYVLYKKKK